MPKKTTKASKRKRIKILPAVSFVAVLSVISVLMTIFLVPVLSNNDQFTDFIYSLGPLGPLAFVVIEFIQSLIPVWSGQPFEVFGGAMYGWWAVPLIWIGSILAYGVAFLVVRHVGRPLVKKIVGEKTLEQFDFLLNTRSGLPLFVCNLIPFFPDDLVCFGGGLSKLTFWRYMLIVALSRPLMIVVNTAIGIGLDNQNIVLLGSIVAIGGLIVFLISNKRNQIMGKLRTASERKR